MRARRGVSLVEVLVATVLLTVGVGGCLSALLAAAQLRLRASVRETVATAADARVTWFAAQACVGRDTFLRSAEGALVSEAWRVTRDTAGAQLDGAATRSTGAHAARLSLLVRRSCP